MNDVKINQDSKKMAETASSPFYRKRLGKISLIKGHLGRGL